MSEPGQESSAEETPREEWDTGREPEAWDDAPGEGEADPVLRPLPGFGGYDVIMGASAGNTPFDVTDPAAGQLDEQGLGEVLLELQGARGRSTLWLVLFLGTGLLGAVVLYVGPTLGLRYAKALPFANDRSLVAAICGVLVLLLAVALHLASRSLVESSRALLTSRGVALQHAQAASFLPWEQLERYRADAETYVIVEGPQGELTLPTPDPVQRATLLALLEERGLDRQS